jgi:hypothetical protein
MNWREDVYPSQIISRLSVSAEQYQPNYLLGLFEMLRLSLSFALEMLNGLFRFEFGLSA